MSKRIPMTFLVPWLLVSGVASGFFMACAEDPKTQDGAGAGNAAGAGGTAGAGGSAVLDDGGTDGDAPDSTTELSACDPARGPVTPIGTEDAEYTQQTQLQCFEAPCLCSPAARDFVDKLLACEPIAGGYWWGLGSMYARVAGRKDGNCVIEVGVEGEGAVSYRRCNLPLPLSPWPGLATDGETTMGTDGFLEGIIDQCELVGSCCLLEGCPDPCSASPIDPPLCPTELPGALSCDDGSRARSGRRRAMH